LCNKLMLKEVILSVSSMNGIRAVRRMRDEG
jgi:hypothetical protein